MLVKQLTKITEFVFIVKRFSNKKKKKMNGYHGKNSNNHSRQIFILLVISFLQFDLIKISSNISYIIYIIFHNHLK